MKSKCSSVDWRPNNRNEFFPHIATCKYRFVEQTPPMTSTFFVHIQSCFQKQKILALRRSAFIAIQLLFSHWICCLSVCVALRWKLLLQFCRGTYGNRGWGWWLWCHMAMMAIMKGNWNHQCGNFMLPHFVIPLHFQDFSFFFFSLIYPAGNVRNTAILEEVFKNGWKTCLFTCYSLEGLLLYVMVIQFFKICVSCMVSSCLNWERKSGFILYNDGGLMLCGGWSWRKKIADDTVNMRRNNCKFSLQMFYPKKKQNAFPWEKKREKKGKFCSQDEDRRKKKVDIMGTLGKGITMRVEKWWSQFDSPPQYFFDSWWTLSSDRALQQKSTPHLLQMVPELKHYFCRPYWY